ncbi:MAG: DNA translocase FtsK, partial [Oscillospiraceae bacterium]|nr:DNA translocase FtsK [Oscillospiraceae bacterium]
MFGWSSFFIGPILIYIAVMSSMDKLNSNGLAFRCILSLILLLLVSAAFQIFLAGKPDAETLVAYVKSLYNDGIKLRGGGLFSAILGFPLMLLGQPGDRIAVILLIFLCSMVLTGTTVIQLLRSAKKPVEKITTGYHELVNAIPVKQQTEIDTASFEKPRRKASIDIPLGDEPAAKPKKAKATPKKEISVSEDVLRSKKKLLESAGVEQPEEQLVTHASEEFLAAAAAKAAAAPTAAESEQPLIDDIINRVAKLQQQKASIAEPLADAVVEAAEVVAAGSETAAEPVTEAVPEPPAPPEYHLPPVTLLREPSGNYGGVSPDELRQNAQLLVDTLQSFGVQTRIIDISRGPAVTRYELQPSAGVKISKITSLADDIALNLASSGVRIEAPIPNKAAVGIEVPNRSITPVTLREVIDSKEFNEAKSKVTVALGRDISGSLCFANIEKMPHLMIAGATGSGKSVCINTIIMSILFKAKPDEVKLLLIDPKEVELSVYNGLPHLVTPVVTAPKKAAGALGWAVSEMDTRYKLFAAHNVREINSFNRMVESQQTNGEPQDENAPKLSKMPHYIIVVDELADLMMTAPADVEDHICRLAQKARAAGIHLIIATQRPSVDVITGVIKANIPSRIAFAVSSQIDSRTILDSAGAEKLLGMGDMLFAPVGSTKPTRIQGCFVSDEEIERVISFIKSSGATEYDQQIIEEIDKHVPTGKSGGSSAASGGDSDGSDEMLNPAIECVVEAGIASTSLLQRKLKLGYARAARIIDELEARGIVGPFEGSKPRA